MADLGLDRLVENTACVLAQAFNHTALDPKEEMKQALAEDGNAVVVELRTGGLAQG